MRAKLSMSCGITFAGPAPLAPRAAAVPGAPPGTLQVGPGIRVPTVPAVAPGVSTAPPAVVPGAMALPPGVPAGAENRRVSPLDQVPRQSTSTLPLIWMTMVPGVGLATGPGS